MRGLGYLSKRQNTRRRLLASAIAATGMFAGFGGPVAFGDIIDLQYLSSWGAQSVSQAGFTTVNIGDTGFSSPTIDTFSISSPGVSPADDVTITATSTSNDLLPRNRTGYTASTYAGLYDSLMFANSGTTTFGTTISGLISGASYQLTLYAADASNPGTETFTDVSNPSNTTSESWTAAAPTSLTQYSGTLTLTANGSGAIAVNVTDTADSGQAFLNGLSLSFIAPEPTSLGAFAAVTGLLALRRRRHHLDRS